MAAISMQVPASDMRKFKKEIEQLSERDAAKAISWALNDTAKDVLNHVQHRMKEVFNKPTPFALKAFTIRGARPTQLEATVQERPSVGSRHFLKVQEAGGPRPQTGVERLLSTRLPFDGIVTAAIPAKGAKLNAYGNWSTGERNQALSAVQAQNDTATNTTDASRKRNKRRAGYFVPRPGSKLSPGIWKRSAKGSVTKIVHFTDTSPRYRALLGFYDGAEEVYIDSLPHHLRRTLSKVIAQKGK